MEVSETKRILSTVRQAIPKAPPAIIEWGHANVQLPTSALSKHFNIEVTPWIREPLERAVDLQTRIVTLMKPVQTGGSALGEVLVLYWMMFARGFLQYNWSNDKRADERWESRVEAILKACKPIAERMAYAEVRKCEIDFGNVFFRMQGAFIADNLDSDSIHLQINEEVHAWEPGHLQKARNRSSAVWNYKSVDISNAGRRGDQLDKAHREGTMQQWQVRCPGCSNPHHEANAVYHVMRTKWEDGHPELGGLRYDSDKARVGKDYDYNLLRPTIRFQMPCRFTVYNEDKIARRQLSLSGRYSEPINVKAELVHRSYTYESVSVDFIDWMALIKQKHEALRSRRLGDLEPWIRYKCERECISYDPDDVPLHGGRVVLTSTVKKNIEGLPEPRLRLFALDRQQGRREDGEFPYWWLLIRDFQVVNDALKSLLVCEEKVETDEQAIYLIDMYHCNRWHGVADSGDDTTHVYTFCLKYGINAIKGGNAQMYSHDGGGGALRVYGPERPLHSFINAEPMFPYHEIDGEMWPDPREPHFWLYSKQGIRERLHWLRTYTDFQTPADVSDDYKAHQEAEERIERPHPRTGEPIVEWIQQRRRNDQFVNECYIAMQLDRAGGIKEQPKKDEKK